MVGRFNSKKYLEFVTRCQQYSIPEIHGYFDTQYQWLKKSKSPGFLIYDGALYASKNFDSLEFMIDLPFSWKGLSADLEFDLRKVGGADWGMGVMSHNVYAFTDALSVGLRGDWIRKIVNYQVLQLTAGPQWVAHEHLRLKTDYTVSRTQAAAGGLKTTAHGVNISGILVF